MTAATNWWKNEIFDHAKCMSNPSNRKLRHVGILDRDRLKEYAIAPGSLRLFDRPGR